MITPSHIDHLVVAAETLDQGVQWCESVLGVVPGPGGQHAFMGTHNRLLRIASPTYPRAYFEIIAIDPAAPQPSRQRWFDMDDPALQHALHETPRLIHFVAATANASAALKGLRQVGIERGPLVRTQRETATGPLRWQISVRRDGQRLFYGGLPTIIQWGAMHPADSLPDSGLGLLSVKVRHPRPTDLRAAHAAIGLQGVAVEQGPPNVVATLSTPKGIVTLESAGA